MSLVFMWQKLQAAQGFSSLESALPLFENQI